MQFYGKNRFLYVWQKLANPDYMVNICIWAYVIYHMVPHF